LFDSVRHARVVVNFWLCKQQRKPHVCLLFLRHHVRLFFGRAQCPGSGINGNDSASRELRAGKSKGGACRGRLETTQRLGRRCVGIQTALLAKLFRGKIGGKTGRRGCSRFCNLARSEVSRTRIYCAAFARGRISGTRSEDKFPIVVTHAA